MSENMWVVPDAANIRTPVTIFREQAANLTNATNGLLNGFAFASGSGNNIAADLRIVVPALNGYQYIVASYQQEVGRIYPGVFRSHLDNDITEINSEEQFENRLRDLLRSEKMQDLLKSLLAQAKAS